MIPPFVTQLKRKKKEATHIDAPLVLEWDNKLRQGRVTYQSRERWDLKEEVNHFAIIVLRLKWYKEHGWYSAVKQPLGYSTVNILKYFRASW